MSSDAGYGAFAQAQVAAAESISARHRIEGHTMCSCARPVPCPVTQTVTQRRDHFLSRLTLMQAPTLLLPLPTVRGPAGHRTARWRRLPQRVGRVVARALS